MRKIAKCFTADAAYDSLFMNLVSLLEAARRTTAKAVNHIITATYWWDGALSNRSQRDHVVPSMASG
jgi:hypothetical protein